MFTALRSPHSTDDGGRSPKQQVIASPEGVSMSYRAT
jgi:hypothetical protein